jgi:hypothetical protein
MIALFPLVTRKAEADVLHVAAGRRKLGMMNAAVGWRASTAWFRYITTCPDILPCGIALRSDLLKLRSDLLKQEIRSPIRDV